MAGDAARGSGIYGFGAAAHIVAQVRAPGPRASTPSRARATGGAGASRCALGAMLGRRLDAAPPEPLDAAIIFAPVGALVPAALRAVARGGAVVCAGIHMSDIPSFPYRLLWEERCIRSVANLTRETAKSSCVWFHRPASRPRSRRSTSNRPTTPSPPCGGAASPAGFVLVNT